MSEGTFDAAAIVDATYQSPPLGSSISRVSVGSTAEILLAFNTKRAFIVLQNLGSPLFVSLGAAVTVESYSFRMAPGAKTTIDKWGGVITAIRDNQTDDVLVTEVA